MYDLTAYYNKERKKTRPWREGRSPTQWLNGIGSQYASYVTVTRGRNGGTTTNHEAAFEDYVSYYKNIAKSCCYLRHEHGALCAVETLLGVKLERQFVVNEEYLVDGYDVENNIVYEVDEAHHALNVEEDKKREEKIKSILGCKFVRIPIKNRR